MAYSKEHKIEMDELIRLKDFHLAEYHKFKGMIDNSKEKIKRNTAVRMDATAAMYAAKYKKDCDAVYSILKKENREIGTGELCTFLNERLDYTRVYNSTEFSSLLGNRLKADKRFYTKIGHVKGKRTTLWGLRVDVTPF